MRPGPAALALLCTLLAGCTAPGLPGPGPVEAAHHPWASASPGSPASPASPASPPASLAFGTLVCPGPTPARPLERCNLRATAGNGPANEIDLAVDPADPGHMVVVGKGYRYTRLVGQAFLGAVITPFATTFDGGLTWAEGYLQPLGPHLATLPLLGEEVGMTPDSESDPVVEFAPDGAVLVQTLRVSGEGGLPMYRSLDGGVTFAEVGSAYAGGTDKNWMVADPATGNMYTVTLHDSGTGFAKSTDNGLTWTPPVKVCNCRLPGIDVGPDGVIYVVGVTGSSLRFVTSADQGQTWSDPSRTIAALASINTNPCNLRLFRMSSIAVVQASRVGDDLYVVWNAQPPGTPWVGGCPDVPELDIYLLHSPDRGATWEAPVRINDDVPSAVPIAQFMPSVAVSPNGRDVHVAWLDQRADPTGLLAEVYYAHSPDAGATWAPNLKVSDAPFLTTLSHHQSAVPMHTGVFVGDYIGLSATDAKAVVAFPDTRYGRSDIFVATIV